MYAAILRLGIASAFETGVWRVVTAGVSRARFLRRGAVGGGALLVSAAGLPGLARVTSAAAAGNDTTAPPDSDLAYLRLLIAGELLAIDFQTRALASGRLAPDAVSLARQVRADEHDHYKKLAALMVAAGQTPATSADITFSYPKGSFRSQASIVRLARRLERTLLGAYIGAIENLQTPQLRLVAGRIAANEGQHAGALAALDGEPVIGKAFAPSLSMAAVSDALDEFES